MNRRGFITFIGGGTFTRPLTAQAQQLAPPQFLVSLFDDCQRDVPNSRSLYWVPSAGVPITLFPYRNRPSMYCTTTLGAKS
jgi:hypothetical protein